MTKTQRIHRKISGKHLLWFAESNQWIVFEKPAYKVYKMLRKGKTFPKMQASISKKYNLNKKESSRFCQEILDGIFMSEKTLNSPDIAPKPAKQQKENIDFYSKKHYLIYEKRIDICYGNKLLEYYIHPPLAYLETKNDSRPDCSYMLYAAKEEYVLSSTPAKLYYTCNEISLLKRRLSLYILNLIYNASDEDWFSRVHASVVGNKEHAIIMTSGSGAGKSTLAALLQKRGMRILSDDLAPMMKQNMVYPVPSALSIKKGAFDLVKHYLPDSMLPLDAEYLYGSKEVAFLSPQVEAKDAFTPLPAKAIVFVSYKKNAKFKFKRLSTLDALKRYHHEAWVDKSCENAMDFIDWFEKLSYYELRYSNTEKAMDIISSLFEELTQQE